jgi:IS5 family transposase
MHQIHEGRHRYLGMKLHIGLDSRLKLVYSLMTTAANVFDRLVIADLLTATRQV